MPKIWKSETSTKAAIKKLGMSGMTHKIISKPGGYSAVFYVEDDEDWSEVRSRGFEAVIDPASAAD